MMRGINTTVRRLRRKVFEEVAALGFKADADTLCDDMEAIPYALVNDETEQYRDSVYRARAVVRELKFGLGLVAAGLYRTDPNDSILPPSNVCVYQNRTATIRITCNLIITQQ